LGKQGGEMKINCFALVAVVLLVSAAPSSAQSIGYAGALGQLAASCGSDIGKFCKTVNLGGGRMTRCLEQNRAAISARCKASMAAMQTLLTTREQARAAVPQVCDADIRRVCAGVQAGDGNLMECFHKAKQNISAPCQKVVADAGYEATIDPSAPTTQVALSSTELVNSLQGVEQAGPRLTAASLRQMAVQGLNDPSRADRMNRAPLTDDLDKLAQLTIAIQFDLNSARIRPDSFQAVGLMADALYHPHLQGYRFLIIGHTDGRGSRESNLKLSQQRADAIREALINPFGIAPSRIEAVGLGEEQLLKRANPEAAENRRVQLVNVGPGR
jgi:outer membrane protein OmpA-like peptidoglycan-associated protein